MCERQTERQASAYWQTDARSTFWVADFLSVNVEVVYLFRFSHVFLFLCACSSGVPEIRGFRRVVLKIVFKIVFRWMRLYFCGI